MISIPVFADTDVESDETVQVTLTGATPGAGIDRAVGTGTILNDDPGGGTPTVSIGDVSAVVLNQGKGPITVPITLSAPQGSLTGVHYMVAFDETATTKEVSIHKAGSLAFAPGALDASIPLSLKQDPTLTSGSHTFTITLFMPSGVALGRSTGTVMLLAP